MEARLRAHACPRAAHGHHYRQAHNPPGLSASPPSARAYAYATATRQRLGANVPPPNSQKPGRKPGGRPSLATAPATCKQLTPAEVRRERLALCIDMVQLVLEAEDSSALPPDAYGTLAGVHQDLTRVWVELRQSAISRA